MEWYLIAGEVCIAQMRKARNEFVFGKVKVKGFTPPPPKKTVIFFCKL